ncbi:kunitz-type protease inhibitor 1a [Denticeps clupeoides]|uniref:Uncharacterized protein n=1 Tax=Denticeps clupeoides TaxID=299321 RepID=A0AAY4CZA1_9TELE|nr:kunitz-type protease inhibitor 1-like [Denticeps clupeoides]
MTFSLAGLLLGTAVAFLHLCSPRAAQAQDFGEQCLANFSRGKENFVLDTDDSVKVGATFLASPVVTRSMDCIVACCKNPSCNLALMENGAEPRTIKTCYLFDCLYRHKKVCRFVRKDGFSNFILTSVLGDPITDGDKSISEDKPPIANAGQDRVVQPQENVILNGVQSKDDKKIEKYEWQMLSGLPSVLMQKTTFPDEVMVSNLSAGVYKFQLTVTDSAGQSNTATVSVLVLTPEQSTHLCLVPKKAGPCRGSFPRWHYNAFTETCEEFIFGGCWPNKNNYLHQEDCKTACDGTSVRSVDGHSSRKVTVPTGEECGGTCGGEQFTCSNGCCLDKSLVCDDEKQCSDGSDEALCEQSKDKLRSLLAIRADNKDIHCTQPPITGPCRQGETKWYYDPYEQKCSPFYYGGCDGNENRFNAENECKDTCSGVTEKDVYVHKQEFEYQAANTNKITLVIAILLCIAIFFLVLVLTYCLLKGRKKKLQTNMAVNGYRGSHNNILDDTEKLVYNSTTKPI